MECAVCLTEVAAGETIRTLPGCRHGFHLECIDKWFSSNSTCPICRCSLEAAKSKNAILGEAQQRGLSDSSVANRDLPLQEVVVMPSDDSVEGSSSCAGQGSRKPGRFLAIEIPVVALQNCGRVGFQRQMR
ncbi:hypothetical protein HPP92_016043 [Vanilla planifolia]|uniref:RING-type domain-containing protein n=1 Tax=Vanilla planifolia TaxID=51239 RepID=A0A835QMC2_VANPL|nr:hypothetical protein HPP92_016043 [Vanilla planifolia]